MVWWPIQWGRSLCCTGSGSGNACPESKDERQGASTEQRNDEMAMVTFYGCTIDEGELTDKKEDNRALVEGVLADYFDQFDPFSKYDELPSFEKSSNFRTKFRVTDW